jgi:formylglycine-generating enzyme
MVRLPEGYCIDSTEVTRTQYQTWLDTNPSTAGQISDCTWNTTFAPDASCLGNSYVCETDCDSHPQVCVDWCDTYAYCQAVGKRLCGKIGGGPNAYDDHANVSLSQLYNACTSHDPVGHSYPYGNTYQGQTCNGSDYWNVRVTALAVGTLTGCQSPVAGYAGVYDLSGNVSEWEDSCNGTGQSAACRVHGGSFVTGTESLTCGAAITLGRGTPSVGVGIRCCSSP